MEYNSEITFFDRMAEEQHYADLCDQEEQFNKKTWWVTKDREKVRISDMGDRHLSNTIEFLRRNRYAYELQYALSIPDDLGDAASLAVDQEIESICSMTTDEALSLLVSPYERLLSEAKHRGLNLIINGTGDAV